MGNAAATRTRAMLLLMGALFVPSALHAQSCESAGEFTSELWLRYIELARETG